MEKNVPDEALRGIELAREMIGMVREGNLEPHEGSHLEAFLDNEYAGMILDRLSNTENYRMDDSRRQTAVSKLLSSIIKSQQRKRLRRIVKGYSAAASVVILFAMFFFFSKETPTLVEVATLPFSTPTLIMHDGKAVDLATENRLVGTLTISPETIADNEPGSETTAGEGLVEYNTIIVPSRFRYKVTLSDGSNVTLNANSKLRYPARFNGGKREVFLTGEGYFDIKASDAPFMVVTSDLIVTAYGTLFNVNTNSDKGIEAVLLSGSVGVTPRKGQHSEVLLSPSQAYIFDPYNESGSVQNVDKNDYTAWTEGFFRSSAGTLESFLMKLSAWYGISFEFRNQALGDIILTVSLSMELDVKEVLLILNSTIGVTFNEVKTDVYMVK